MPRVTRSSTRVLKNSTTSTVSSPPIVSKRSTTARKKATTLTDSPTSKTKSRTSKPSSSTPKLNVPSRTKSRPQPVSSTPKLNNSLQESKRRSRKSSEPSEEIKEPDELDKALENVRNIQKSREKINIAEIRELKKKFKQTCDNTKRETQKLEQERSLKKPARTSRSGTRRGVVKEAVYSDGKIINRGIDDSQMKYDQDELDYLKKTITKFKEVKELKYDYLKYLVIDVFLQELKDIKEGKLNSSFHDRYKSLAGKSRTDLLSDVWTSLFTNEQRDYINGLLQGAFETTTKDSKGDIKHSDIKYVGIVMYGEITIRIVKYLHKFKTNEETIEFMIKSARAAYGFDDEDDT